MATPIVLPALTPLPPLDQISRAVSDVAKSVGNKVADSVKVKNISGIGLFGFSGSQVLAIALGLIAVTIGLLMFREVREPVVAATKTAVKTAAVA